MTLRSAWRQFGLQVFFSLKTHLREPDSLTCENNKNIRMENYIIQEIREGTKSYRIDYESLANKPDLSDKIIEGSGISVSGIPDTSGQVSISLSEDIKEKLDSLTESVFPVRIYLKEEYLRDPGSLEITGITLSWEIKNFTGTSWNVRIYRSTEGDTWQLISGSLGPGVSSYFISDGISESVRYKAMLISGGASIESNIIKITYKGRLYYKEMPGTFESQDITENLVRTLKSEEIGATGNLTMNSVILNTDHCFLFVYPGTPKVIVRNLSTDKLLDPLESGTISMNDGESNSSIYTWTIIGPYPGTTRFSIEWYQADKYIVEKIEEITRRLDSPEGLSGSMWSRSKIELVLSQDPESGALVTSSSSPELIENDFVLFRVTGDVSGNGSNQVYHKPQESWFYKDENTRFTGNNFVSDLNIFLVSSVDTENKKICLFKLI